MLRLVICSVVFAALAFFGRLMFGEENEDGSSVVPTQGLLPVDGDEDSLPQEVDWRKKPRDAFWAGVGLHGWPAVGIEYPVQPSDTGDAFPLDYSTLCEFVVVPNQAANMKDKQFGSRCSWLCESAYDKLDKLQDEEMNARFRLVSPWRTWKEAALTKPEKIQKVVSMRHNRIFSGAYGDAVYDYPLGMIDGWRVRFVSSVYSRRLPLKIDFLRSQDVTDDDIAEVNNQLQDANRLSDVPFLKALLADLPLVDFGGMNWGLEISEQHENPSWTEATFTGPMNSVLGNYLEFVVGPKGILLRLEGPGVQRLGTELETAPISQGPIKPSNGNTSNAFSTEGGPNPNQFPLIAAVPAPPTPELTELALSENAASQDVVDESQIVRQDSQKAKPFNALPPIGEPKASVPLAATSAVPTSRVANTPPQSAESWSVFQMILIFAASLGLLGLILGGLRWRRVARS